jgi:hypothetical protein
MIAANVRVVINFVGANPEPCSLRTTVAVIIENAAALFLVVRRNKVWYVFLFNHGGPSKDHG